MSAAVAVRMSSVLPPDSALPVPGGWEEPPGRCRGDTRDTRDGERRRAQRWGLQLPDTGPAWTVPAAPPGTTRHPRAPLPAD